MAEVKKTEQPTEEPLVLDRDYYTPKMIGQLESDKLKAPPIYEDDRQIDSSNAIDMRDTGKKALLFPMSPANSLNDFEKSPWVGKAVGMNMIIEKISILNPYINYFFH